MTLEEEVVALRAEVASAQALIAQLQARIAELERRKTPPPAFVRANTPTERPVKARKRRAPEHNAGRRSRRGSSTTPWSAVQCAPTCCAGTAWRARAR